MLAAPPAPHVLRLYASGTPGALVAAAYRRQEGFCFIISHAAGVTPKTVSVSVDHFFPLLFKPTMSSTVPPATMPIATSLDEVPSSSVGSWASIPAASDTSSAAVGTQAGEKAGGPRSGAIPAVAPSSATPSLSPVPSLLSDESATCAVPPGVAPNMSPDRNSPRKPLPGTAVAVVDSGSPSTSPGVAGRSGPPTPEESTSASSTATASDRTSAFTTAAVPELLVSVTVGIPAATFRYTQRKLIVTYAVHVADHRLCVKWFVHRRYSEFRRLWSCLRRIQSEQDRYNKEAIEAETGLLLLASRHFATALNTSPNDSPVRAGQNREKSIDVLKALREVDRPAFTAAARCSQPRAPYLAGSINESFVPTGAGLDDHPPGGLIRMFGPNSDAGSSSTSGRVGGPPSATDLSRMYDTFDRCRREMLQQHEAVMKALKKEIARVDVSDLELPPRLFLDRSNRSGDEIITRRTALQSLLRQLLDTYLLQTTTVPNSLIAAVTSLKSATERTIAAAPARLKAFLEGDVVGDAGGSGSLAPGSSFLTRDSMSLRSPSTTLSSQSGGSAVNGLLAPHGCFGHSAQPPAFLTLGAHGRIRALVLHFLCFSPTTPQTPTAVGVDRLHRQQLDGDGSASSPVASAGGGSDSATSESGRSGGASSRRTASSVDGMSSAAGSSNASVTNESRRRGSSSKRGVSPDRISTRSTSSHFSSFTTYDPLHPSRVAPPLAAASSGGSTPTSLPTGGSNVNVVSVGSAGAYRRQGWEDSAAFMGSQTTVGDSPLFRPVQATMEWAPVATMTPTAEMLGGHGRGGGNPPPQGAPAPLDDAASSSRRFFPTNAAAGTQNNAATRPRTAFSTTSTRSGPRQSAIVASSTSAKSSGVVSFFKRLASTLRDKINSPDDESIDRFRPTNAGEDILGPEPTDSGVLPPIQAAIAAANAAALATNGAAHSASSEPLEVSFNEDGDAASIASSHVSAPSTGAPASGGSTTPPEQRMPPPDVVSWWACPWTSKGSTFGSGSSGSPIGNETEPRRLLSQRLSFSFPFGGMALTVDGEWYFYVNHERRAKRYELRRRYDEIAFVIKKLNGCERNVFPSLVDMREWLDEFRSSHPPRLYKALATTMARGSVGSGNVGSTQRTPSGMLRCAEDTLGSNGSLTSPPLDYDAENDSAATDEQRWLARARELARRHDLSTGVGDGFADIGRADDPLLALSRAGRILDLWPNQHRGHHAADGSDSRTQSSLSAVQTPPRKDRGLLDDDDIRSLSEMTSGGNTPARSVLGTTPRGDMTASPFPVNPLFAPPTATGGAASSARRHTSAAMGLTVDVNQAQHGPHRQGPPGAAGMEDDDEEYASPPPLPSHHRSPRGGEVSTSRSPASFDSDYLSVAEEDPQFAVGSPTPAAAFKIIAGEQSQGVARQHGASQAGPHASQTALLRMADAVPTPGASRSSVSGGTNERGQRTSGGPGQLLGVTAGGSSLLAPSGSANGALAAAVTYAAQNTNHYVMRNVAAAQVELTRASGDGHLTLPLQSWTSLKRVPGCACTASEYCTSKRGGDVYECCTGHRIVIHSAQMQLT